jgi:hypothetical protein
MQQQSKSAQRQRLTAVFVLIALAIIAVAIRYVLFNYGVLYGEAAAKMASLAVAGIIVVAGYLPLRMLRSSHNQTTGGGAATESIVATVAAILGLAVTAYSISELVAPNTPVAASAPACAGVPVYGAKYFAVTVQNGANARSGPGREYQQVNRYASGCTLGFDGYCIGSAEPDFVLGTPDQRWLLVHDRTEFVAAAVVLSQSAESALGTIPDSRCAMLGGLSQPHVITQFTYDSISGQLTAAAPGAVAVGYGLATPNFGSAGYHTGALGTSENSGFLAKLPVSLVASDAQANGDRVLLGAAVCLAEGVPVTSSLGVQLLTVQNSKIIRSTPYTHISADIKARLAEIACNSTR